MNKKARFGLVVCGLFFSGFFLLSAEEPAMPVTPQLVESQLAKAEEDFHEAQEMFDPWYAGPLLAGGAHVLQAGKFNIQPYLYYIDNYGHFDAHGKSHDVRDLQQVNPVAILQFGVYDKRIDGVFTLQGLYNKQRGHSIMNITDTSLSLRYGLAEETMYYPAVLFGVKETFPTGKCNKLSPHKGGVDATGSGAYTTSLILNFAKIVWWVWTEHPMSFRLSNSYAFPSHVSVKNFNAYGGGYGTWGKVHPGQSFSTDFGYEFSFTQRWVLALDVAYSYSMKTTFLGTTGVDATGSPASVGGPFNDQLSLAPALEYNPNADLGFIGGIWFSVWGRNSSNFISGIISTTYTF